MFDDRSRRPGPVEQWFLNRAGEAGSDAAANAWGAPADAIRATKSKLRELAER